MKKIVLLSLIGIVVVFSLLFYQGNRDPKKEISNAIGIDVRDGVLGTEMDSHGGFHGDGMYFASMKFSEQFIVEEISDNNAWKSLPLSENLTTLVYETTTEYGQRKAILTDENEEAVFPWVRHGYYFFLDRQSPSADRYDDTEVLGRYSYNFTIAIYDTDADILYYAELDT